MKNVTLRAGFGRVVITPPHDANNDLLQPIEIAKGQFITHVDNDLCASAIALDDGETTILLMTLDLRDIRTSLYVRIADAVTEATGIPKEQISLSTTHTHSAPEVDFDTQDKEATEAYEALLIERVPLAAKAALEDLCPTKMYVGSSRTDRLSFVRRYQLSDGRWTSHVSRVYVDWSTARRHESEIDNLLQTVKFEREGKKNIIMTNWPCHPATKVPTINSDWVHFLRRGVEEANDAYFAFFQGAEGNINNRSFIAGEQKYSGNNMEMVEKIGNELVTVVADSMKDMEALPCAPIKVKFEIIPHEIERYNNRVRLFAATIGDFAFVSNPFELFHELGEFVRDNSPCKMTFFVCLANGYDSYLGPAALYEHGGYEIDCSRFDQDKYFADKMAQRLVDTLCELQAQR